MRTRSLSTMLAGHPFLAGLSPARIEVIAGCARNVRLSAGAFLYREGEPADRFYLVRHGTVVLEAFAPGRGSIPVQTVQPGEFVGSAWLIPPYRHGLDARAAEPVRAFAFDGACLRGKCEADPALGYALMQRFVPPLVHRLSQLALQALDVYGPAEAAP